MSSEFHNGRRRRRCRHRRRRRLIKIASYVYYTQTKTVPFRTLAELPGQHRAASSMKNAACRIPRSPVEGQDARRTRTQLRKLNKNAREHNKTARQRASEIQTEEERERVQKRIVHVGTGT